MAKKKDKKDGRKRKAPKLPKTIAGVKVPKALRGPGGRLLAAIDEPLLIDLATAALSAAAGALASTLERAEARRGEGEEAGA